MPKVKYDESSIKHFEPKAHIRKRPEMYIGKKGDGTEADDGIYVLVKEVIDNAVDEFRMESGKVIDIHLVSNPDNTQTIKIRDQGRGIPLGSLIDCVSQINTGGKYDSEAFQKSVGLNGVGVKAVNALSVHFLATTARDGKIRSVTFSQGEELAATKVKANPELKSWKSGTEIEFAPDPYIFEDYQFQTEYLEKMFFNYTALNPGLTINFTYNGDGKKTFYSTRGLPDLLESAIQEGGSKKEMAYDFIHLTDPKNPDVDIVITHGNHYGEEIYSFVNGQYTRDGGTHVTAFKEALGRTINTFLKKNYDNSDIRGGLIAAISIRIQEPGFESQTKTKLGSTHTLPQKQGVSLRVLIGDFLKTKLDDFLHRSPATAKALQSKIQENERERKEISGIREKTKQIAKKNSIINKKLRDCQIHWNSKARAHQERKGESSIFITEGDSAANPITAARDSTVQAVFPLRGKPKNCFGMTKKNLYEKNEEMALLQNTLGLENGLDDLRYNKVIIATDADVDGMHIRLLIATFFLQYHIDVIKEGHLYFLQTPLFRVRNKKETRYCYSAEEKDKAVSTLGNSSEITRFKGLGEISPSEFKNFIGPKIRLEKVMLNKDSSVEEMLRFYMGDNTPERQKYICENLVVEEALEE